MFESQRAKLRIRNEDLDAINRFLADPSNPLTGDLLSLVAKYGAPEEINAKAARARELPNLLGRLEEMNSPYLADLRWLMRMRDEGAFVSLDEFSKAASGKQTADMRTDRSNPVVLEISACQYFPG